jgi:hypothetical protein
MSICGPEGAAMSSMTRLPVTPVDVVPVTVVVLVLTVVVVVTVRVMLDVAKVGLSLVLVLVEAVLTAFEEVSLGGDGGGFRVGRAPPSPGPPATTPPQAPIAANSPSHER